MNVVISIFSIALIIILLRILSNLEKSNSYKMSMALAFEKDCDYEKALAVYNELFNEGDDYKEVETIHYDAFIRYSSCIIKNKVTDKISSWHLNHYQILIHSPNNEKKDDIILEYILLLIENSQFNLIPDLIENQITRANKIKAQAYLDYSIAKLKIEANKIISEINNNIFKPEEYMKLLELINGKESILQIFTEQYEQIKKYEPSIINRLLSDRDLNFDYLKLFYLITDREDFLNNYHLLKNAAIMADRICANGKITKENYKDIISTFITAIFNDIIFIDNLELTEWDDNYDFDFTNSYGYMNTAYLNNFNSQKNDSDLSLQVLDINNTRSFLIEQFENQLGKINYNPPSLKKEVSEFYRSELKSIISLNKLLLTKISINDEQYTFTPYFGKRMNLVEQLVRNTNNSDYKLSYDSFEAILPYLLLEYEIKLNDIDETKLKYIISGLTSTKKVEKRFKILLELNIIKMMLTNNVIELKNLPEDLTQLLGSAEVEYLPIVENELMLQLENKELSKKDRAGLCQKVYNILPQSKYVCRCFSNELIDYSIYQLHNKGIQPIKCFERFIDAYKIDKENYYVQKNIAQIVKEFSIIWASESKLFYLIKDLRITYELKLMLADYIKQAHNEFTEYDRMARIKGEPINNLVVARITTEFTKTFEALHDKPIFHT